MNLSHLIALLLPLLATATPFLPSSSPSLLSRGGSAPQEAEASRFSSTSSGAFSGAFSGAAVAELDESKTFNGKAFPLTVSPSASDVNPADWVVANKAQIDALLPQHGAILLRGFSVPTANDFSAVIKALDYEEQPYIGGNAVRRVVADRVFTSNESPPSERIPFHHEMAQVPNFPTKVFFYCQQPSSEGGETPIVLSSEVCSALKEGMPELYQRFLKEGVRYIRTMPMEDDAESALGRGWKSTYQTDSKAEAEEEMRKAGATWEWLPNGDLKTKSAKLSAIREVDGKMVFFNQVVAAYTGWNDCRNVGTSAIVFGDSEEELPKDDMKKLVKKMDKLSVAFEWEQGDILIIDNRLAMHSRKPFVKPRIVLASLARG